MIKYKMYPFGQELSHILSSKMCCFMFSNEKINEELAITPRCQHFSALSSSDIQY